MIAQRAAVGDGTGSRRSSRTRAALVCALLALAPGPGTAQIGVVTDVEGSPELVRDEQVYALASGVEVYESDLVRTDATASVQLEMDDGSVLELAPAGEMHLSEYRLRDDRSVAEAAVSVLTGFLRFVASKLQPSSRYELASGTLTVGIRGTEGILEASEDDVRLRLDEGRVEVFELGDRGELGRALLVEPGGFVERRRGERLRRRARAPDDFERRVPERLRKRVARRKAALQGRRFAPRRLRAREARDLERLERANPRIRSKALRRARAVERRVSPQRAPNAAPDARRRPPSARPGPRDKGAPRADRPPRAAGDRKSRPRARDPRRERPRSRE